MTDRDLESAHLYKMSRLAWEKYSIYHNDFYEIWEAIASIAIQPWKQIANMDRRSKLEESLVKLGLDHDDIYHFFKIADDLPFNPAASQLDQALAKTDSDFSRESPLWHKAALARLILAFHNIHSPSQKECPELMEMANLLPHELRDIFDNAPLSIGASREN